MCPRRLQLIAAKLGWHHSKCWSLGPQVNHGWPYVGGVRIGGKLKALLMQFEGGRWEEFCEKGMCGWRGKGSLL